MQSQQTAIDRSGESGSNAKSVVEGSTSEVLNVLLVARSDDWVRAVEGATEELGSGHVATCGARDAISRLARIAPHYSHVLVNEADADGLFAELADITNEIAEPDTDMLALGQARTQRPNVRVIRAATPQSVRDALSCHTPVPELATINMTELKAALDGAMIETRYQPIVQISDRQPVGLEVLARLNHPCHGTISPDRFVPQIETAGLSAELTRVVSAKAFADLTGTFLAKLNLRMSVNFPLDVLESPLALAVLEQQRQASGVPAHRIIIELTESLPVSDKGALTHALEHLRGLGYGIAIDDVTPTMAEMDALLDLPFTCLKFDKDIVQDVPRSAERRDFVARKTDKAKERGLYVIAEGVETDDIWNMVAAFGIDAAQGFLASRPLPVAAIPIWWESWVTTPHS